MFLLVLICGPETAQTVFVNFKMFSQLLVKNSLGIAQIGKAFEMKLRLSNFV